MAHVAAVVESRQRHRRDAAFDGDVAAEFDVVASEAEGPEIGADELGSVGVDDIEANALEITN